MSFICDRCYEEMELSHVGRNRNKAYCPACGRTFFLDDEDEFINDGSDYDPDEIDEDDDDECDEKISVSEAAMIWASHGKDEDYMFGYDEDELEDAL